MIACFVVGGADLLLLNVAVFPELGEAVAAPSAVPSGDRPSQPAGSASGAGPSELPSATQPSARPPLPPGIFLTLSFESESFELTTDTRRHADALALELKLDDELAVRLDGYTDTRGDTFFNQDLSMRRAEAVRDHLVAAGVEEKRIEVRGLGSTNPRTGDASAEAQAVNRRVEVFRVRRAR